MSIRFSCPAGHRLKVPDEKAGRGMLCPICQESVTVPEVVSASPDVLPPPPPSVDEADSPSGEEQSRLSDGSATVTPPALVRSDLVCDSVARRYHPSPWILASGLFVVLAYSALPALGHLRDMPMPVWVRILLGATAMQAVFLLWMLTARHWAALALLTLLFALTAIGYALIAAFAFTAGDAISIPWGLEPIRSRAAVWSATVLAIYLLATYLCGTAVVRWRRETLGSGLER